MKPYYLGLVLLLILPCATSSQVHTDTGSSTQAENVALFDVSNTDQWNNYRADIPSDEWQLKEGTLMLVVGQNFLPHSRARPTSGRERTYCLVRLYTSRMRSRS